MAKTFAIPESTTYIDEKAIRKEKNRLLKVFREIDKNKLEFVKKQIDNLAYLNLLAEQLRHSISINGTTCGWDNGGGQKGVKDNPDVRNLISVQKNIVSITNQLIDLVPKQKSKSKLEELMEE